MYVDCNKDKFGINSKLAGTIKQVINLSPTGGAVSGPDSSGRKTYTNSVTMNADVLITGGAGLFAAMAGDADFSNVSPVQINIPNPNTPTAKIPSLQERTIR